MSRKQWGHGYWKGVEDAENGKILMSRKDICEYWIAHMCLSNIHKDHDRSLYPVHELIARLCGCEGYELSDVKKIYDYIMSYQPLDCYVSGYPKEEWTQDWFVIPNLDEDEALEKIQSIISKQEEK